jgi:glyoxylase-like metal-dependent hydrolase (beta-lactamase superfamily II)
MSPTCDRRSFLSCGAYVAASFLAVPSLARRAFAEGAEVVVEKPFARIERLHEDVWAVVSTPVGKGGFQPTTLSNGGIVRGKDRVLCIEGFNTPAGAAWLSGVCKELTGRAPDTVALTHFHPDHSSGLAGYQRGVEGPEIVSTAKTRTLLLDRTAPQPEEGKTIARSSQHVLVPDAVLVDPIEPVEIDLGGRKVTLVPRAGHTPSDLTIVVDDPSIVFCGDLYFNATFPYFGDALPSTLTATVQAMRKAGYATFVPGHGSVSGGEPFGVYVEMIEDVGAAAKKAHEAGTPAAEAWKTYKIPERLGNWYLFRPDIVRVAFEAWERELE